MRLINRIRSFNLFGVESCSRGFLQSSLYAFVAKLIAFFTSVLIAFFFGANDSTDVYFYSFSMVLLVATFLSSINVTILIPQTLRLRERVGHVDSVQFLNTFFYGFLLVGVFLSVWVYTNPVKAFSYFSKFDYSVIEANIHIIKLSAILFPFVVINLFLSETLFSFRLFTVSIGFNILNSVSILLFIVLFHQRFGVSSALYGALLAYSIQFFAQCSLLFFKFKWHFGFGFKNYTAKLYRDVLWAQIGNAFSICASYFPFYLLSSYNSGVITSLNYGIKIADTITSLITVHFASVIGTKLNEMYARHEIAQIDQVFRRSANTIIFIMIPLSMCVSAYSTEIIELLFRRGAFDYSSTRMAASFLKIYVLVLPLLGLNAVVARLFMAAQKINVSVYFQIAISCVMISGVYILLEMLGPVGFPITYVTVYFIAVLTVGFIVRRFIPEVRYNLVLIDFFRIFILNIPAIVVIHLFGKLATGLLLFDIISGSALYCVLVAFLNRFYKCNEELNKITGIRISLLKNVAD